MSVRAHGGQPTIEEGFDPTDDAIPLRRNRDLASPGTRGANIRSGEPGRERNEHEDVPHGFTCSENSRWIPEW